MHPELFTLPIIDVSLKTYGFCLMVGFLSAVWLAMRRTQRVKGNPDTALDVAFLSLVFGVIGARVFYVVHYWPSQFAGTSNKFLAVIDIRQGGLEFLGGFLGALIAFLIYAVWKKISIRLYLDIMAPSTMWGLAFGRMGCFFNGCCFGGMCLVSPAGDPSDPWAVQFPYGSPAHVHQWEGREVTVPAELIVSASRTLHPILLPASILAIPVEQREQANRQYQVLHKQYEQAKGDAPEAEKTGKLKKQVEAALQRKKAQDRKLIVLTQAQRFPSRSVPSRATSVSELEQLAQRSQSVPVHPAQLYSAIHALLLSVLLSALFYVRKRHGVVIAAMLVLYPIPRILLELIRADNPYDVGGLTVSQSISLGLFVTGIIALVVLYKWLPERSPLLNGNTSTT